MPLAAGLALGFAMKWSEYWQPTARNPNFLARNRLAQMPSERIGQSDHSVLSSDNRSSFEVNWAFPLAQHLRGYVQFFTGYGENMIDMENNNTRIGVGIALTDWL